MSEIDFGQVIRSKEGYEDGEGRPRGRKEEIEGLCVLKNKNKKKTRLKVKLLQAKVL